MIYEINKTTEKVVDTAIGNAESIEITQVVKQGSIFGPTICCATTAKVNFSGERVDCKYGKTEIVMLIYVDDISVAEGPKEVKRNKEMCKNGSGKENEIQLKQNKVYGSKDGQSKGRRYFRIIESRKNSKNQEIQILKNHNK